MAKKDDFGARIRNAKVLGTLPDEDGRDPFNARFNRDAMSMDNDDASSGRLSSGPPQVLAVTIETGHLFFLCLEQAEDGLYRFKTAAYPPPRRGPLNKPGFHMAVDPNSNYVALASHEGTLVIHRVAHGNGAYRQLDGHTLIQGSVTHVMKDTIIHKMEFLYPHPDDEDHVILLLVVIRGHRTRLLLYEWEVGEDVDNVLSVGERSHRLPDQWDMPLLLIPLTVRQAFLLVCKDSIAACKDILYGPPTCEPVNFDTPPTSVLHYGEGPPLWSAWARPFRLASWMAKKDSIYLAREDGSIVYLEIDANNILDLSVRVLDHQCHISTAFAAMYDQFTDILLVGGDQGPGAVWQVPPRLDPVKLQTLPNWSPVRDFTTTDVFRTWNQEIGTDNSRMVPWSEDHGMNITEPSRIFATSGRGIQGAVCEYRYGFRASIGLDMDFDLPSRECWVLPSDTSRSDAHGYDVLISLFSFSAALRIAPGLDSVHALDQDTCGFDLSSRTILADVLRVSGSATNAAAAVVQITEHSVTVLAPSATPLRQSFADMPGFEGSQIDYASMLGDTVAVSSFDSGKSIIYVIRVCCEPSVQLELVTSISVDGEVTCMTLSERDGTGVVLACVMRGSTQVIQPYLVVGTGAREQPLTPFPIGGSNSKLVDAEWVANRKRRTGQH